MPLGRSITPGLVYKIDLSKIAERENPRTVEAPIDSQYIEPYIIDWGDGTVTQYNSVPSEQITHTYADAGVYTVTIRSATGKIPNVRFCTDATTNLPVWNLTVAVTSIDHFAGQTGTTSLYSARRMLLNTSNMQYLDTRLIGQTKWKNIHGILQSCGSEQPFASICFDFATGIGYANSAFSQSKFTGPIPSGFFANNTALYYLYSLFQGCSNLTSIPSDLFDNCPLIETFSSCFQDCINLNAPYIFWKEDGDLDTDKFPSLTAGSYCYSGCPAAVRAQVPTAYGGTMTVS